MAAHAWLNLDIQLGSTIPKLHALLEKDAQLAAFLDTDLKGPVQFGWASAGSDHGLLCVIEKGNAWVRTGRLTDAAFVLSALPSQWEELYSAMPLPSFQSYWAMFGQNINKDGVEVRGDKDLFLCLSPIWRRIIELSRESLCGPLRQDPSTFREEDHLRGGYVFVDLPTWGKTKIFYEQSGDAEKHPIIFLHTAGSDGRQYHGVMNHPDMLQRCHMTVFDMPGHGRSFPGQNQIPGKHTNNEDAYVAAIGAVIAALGLKKPIVCGASMAGHVGLAVALRAEEVGAGAVIPCQA